MNACCLKFSLKRVLTANRMTLFNVMLYYRMTFIVYNVMFIYVDISNWYLDRRVKNIGYKYLLILKFKSLNLFQHIFLFCLKIQIVHLKYKTIMEV